MGKIKYSRNKKSAHRITRYDYTLTHGWVVRVKYKGELKCNKLFSDSIYGGKLKAKKAAVKFEKEFADRYDRDNIDGRTCKEKFYFSRSQANNKHSNRAGVFKIVKPSTSKGKKLYYWIASIYVEQYKPIIKGFSVQKHGNKGAFEFALNFREENIKKTFGKSGCVR